MFNNIKSKFIQDKMKDGFTNQEARNLWNKNEAYKYKNKLTYDFKGNIERSYYSPMCYWAETTEDF